MRTSCFRRPEQSFTQNPFKSRLQFEIRFPAVNGDDEFRQFEAPLARQKLQNQIRPRFKAQSNELGLVRMRTAQEVDRPVRVGRTANRVMGRAPDLARLADGIHAVRLVVRPVLSARAPGNVFRACNIADAISLSKRALHPARVARPERSRAARSIRIRHHDAHSPLFI